jgi:DNA invertase Pin-like site-specific DNA recombinase
MASAVGYLRVSTDGQAASGLGLDAQRSAITSAAARLGLVVGSWHTDEGVSGGAALDVRPGLLAALDALKRGDVLVVAKRDRLGRDVLNVAMLERLVERKGARIVSAAGEGSDDDGPTSRLMRQIIDAFAEYERALIGTRTKAALKAKRARGYRAGTVPFGYVADAAGKLSTHDGEQRVLSLVRELRGAGFTLQAIADELNVQGFTTRKGTAWRHQYVRALAGLTVAA